MTRADWRPAALIALALAASVTGLANGFAYDDLPLIVQNARVHDLYRLGALLTQSYWPPRWGGSLYRPLTSMAFTLEWTAGHGSPALFHVVSVALYVAVTLIVYALARRVLSLGAAWIAAAAFAVHPVHVEAVANVVGQSELLAAGAVTAAAALYLARRIAAPEAALHARDVAGLAALYAAACLAKEHAIVLPALLLAAECTVVPDSRGWRARWPTLAPVAGTLAAVGGCYVVVRSVVLHGIRGESFAVPWAHVSWGGRWWTMLGVVPEWARLLVWPAHLAAMYSPAGTPLRDGPDAGALLGLVLAVAAVTLAVVARRRAPVAAFGIWWATLALLPVSNLIVRSGVLLAERTLFLPSVGAVLVLGALAQVLVARVRVREGTRRGILAGAAACVLGACVLAAGAWRSARRQPVWHDSRRLIEQSVRDEPLSYRAHFSLMGEMFDAGEWGSAEREARIALRLYSGDPWVYEMLAYHYFVAGQCGLAEPLLQNALSLDPAYADARYMLTTCRTRDAAP